MKRIINILILLLSIIPGATVSPKNDLNSNASIDNGSYLLIKVDDVGGYLSNWEWFYESVMDDSRLNVDIGVIAKIMHLNATHEAYFKNYITNNFQFGIFNHGWDHFIPEFENRSYYYLYTHISYWDYYMKTLFSYVPEVKVLGAPGNSIGNRSDCSLTLYTVLAELHYNLLYFSTCSPSSSQGNAGGNLFYVPFETNLYPRTLSDILTDLNKFKDHKFILTQIHPSHAWNATYFNYVFDNVLSITHRKTLHIQNYYTKFFLPTYQSYFLQNASRFLESRNDANIIPFNNSDYEYSLNPSLRLRDASLIKSNLNSSANSIIDTQTTQSSNRNVLSSISTLKLISLPMFEAFIFTMSLVVLYVVRKRCDRKQR